jgi:FkbM family methyltransferase
VVVSIRDRIKGAVFANPRIAAVLYDQLQRAGMHVNLGRHPLRELLDLARINHVLDVGANVGGFGHRLRVIGYAGHITSFEPVLSAFEELRTVASRDETWSAVRLALGDEDTDQLMHVSRLTNLSSFLPATEWMREHYPETLSEQDEMVPVRRLDTVLDDYVRPEDTTLLKIDTQGYERKVLSGAAESLDRIKGIWIELTYARTLYEDEELSFEMICALNDQGFTLVYLEPLYYNLERGDALQGDGLFLRLE